MAGPVGLALAGALLVALVAAVMVAQLRASVEQRKLAVFGNWLTAAAPDVVVFMPCGYDLPAAVREASCEGGLLERPELAGASAFYAVDASAYFSRPGPRLVDGVEILAAALHPGAATPPPPDSLARLR